MDVRSRPRHGRRWTADELLFVEVNAHVWSWERIACELGRAPDSVYYAFWALCGGRQRLNAAEAGELLGAPRNTMLAWIRAGHLGHVQRFRYTPYSGQKGQRMWRIEYSQLLAFVSDPWHFRLLAERDIQDQELARTARWARREYGDLYVGAEWLAERCGVSVAGVWYWIREDRLPAAKVPSGQGPWPYITPREVAKTWIAEYVEAAKDPRHCAPAAQAAAAELAGFDAEIAAPWREPWGWPAPGGDAAGLN